MLGMNGGGEEKLLLKFDSCRQADVFKDYVLTLT
jgi:hypothetical protein